MPIDKRIDYIELPAADIETAKRFYGEVFSWTFVDYGPDYCSFNDGRLDGGFRRADTFSSSSANGAALVVLYADDLEATRDRVTAAGGAILQDIFSFPGGRRFHFLDVNGNELAVWSDQGA